MPKKNYIISFIRLHSAAGYYLGSLQFLEDNAEYYDRHSTYYPTEEWLQHDFPNSISEEEAFEKARCRGFIYQ